MENTYSVLDIYRRNNNYIILLSGLEMSPINQVTKELCEAFDAIVLDYTHLELDSDLQALNDRVKSLTKDVGNVLFIKGKSFDKDKIKFRVDLHFNISIPNKMINNDILSSKYKEKMTTNYVNKYYNYKEETVISEYIDNMFLHIVDDLEKKLYKDKYSKLNHKVYNESDNSEYIDEPVSQPSRLISNPNALSTEQKNDVALQAIAKEFEEDDTSSAMSDDSVDDFVSEDVLFEPR